MLRTMPRRKFVPALWSVLFAALLHSGSAKPGLCEVETGQSNIILDIEESRGTQVSQSTSPVELPIVGDPFKEVTLDLVFPRDKPVFILNGKKLQLLEPLDRDEDNLSHIVFQLTCTVKATNKKRSIPVIVRVSDNNDNAPHFENTPYETTVSELHQDSKLQHCKEQVRSCKKAVWLPLLLCITRLQNRPSFCCSSKRCSLC